MALVDEIAVKLGISKAEFSSALKESGVDIEDFKKKGEFGEDEGLGGTIKGINKKMRELKELLLAGGIISAVKNFFETAIEAANKNKDSLDENVKAVQRFGKSWESVKGGFAGISVSILGFFAQAGEGIGMLINNIRGISSEQQFALERTATALATQTEEIKKANAIAKIHRDTLFEQADLLGKAKILLHDNLALELQLNKVKVASLEYAKIDAEIKKNIVEAGKLIAEQEVKTATLRKQTSEETKKDKEELNKLFEKDIQYAKDSVKLDEQLAKLAFDRLSPQEKLVQLQNDIYRLSQAIADTSRDENEIKRDKVKLGEAEKLQAEILLDIEQKKTKEAQKQVEFNQHNLDVATQMISMAGFTIDSDPARQRINEANQMASSNASIQREIGALEDEIKKFQQSGSSSARFLIASDIEKEAALRNRLNNSGYLFDPNYVDSLGKGIAATSFHPKDVDAASLQQQTLSSINKNLTSLNDHVTTAFPVT